MIICVCHNVNVSKIKSAIDCGADTVDRIREETLASTCCGKCLFKVNRVLQQHAPAENSTFTEQQCAVKTAIRS
ncbi:NAD(P)H-nitrite reductase [Methylophaga frappieri]|uniref:NAD(P)H-nitrite reductase n=1 Tax=Methylophaga frappieri (strain ATCC BAA-2434 / DSM 25690 / JAM7) TaxID=754477 RepID=I1YF14_METFJ|nr:(2Fe-2S)-binding protein [Methylophaga frappieri]AFJ01507.1 NAD(P)H-nitrite reductase [Methylophaga frappieri]